MISKAIYDCAALLPLKSLKFPDIFSQSLRNRLKFSQLPTHLCTHFCPALHPTSLQNPSPFLSDRVRPPLHPSDPLPSLQSFLSYPPSYLAACSEAFSVHPPTEPAASIESHATPSRAARHCRDFRPRSPHGHVFYCRI